MSSDKAKGRIAIFEADRYRSFVASYTFEPSLQNSLNQLPLI